MAFDFPEIDISVNEETHDWGPYLFNFWTCIPDPHVDQVQSVVVQSTLNDVDTTPQLISRTSLASVGNAVNVWFEYPGAGLAGSHTMIFTVTLQGGGVNRFTMGYVVVT